LVDTGEDTMTGGRLARVAEYLKNEEAFCFTYGDGLSDVNISELIDFHKKHGRDATLTSVYPPGRFGALDIENNQVKRFTEKPKGDGALVNGGFFVLSPKVLERISGDNCVWEQEPLKGLAEDNSLMSYKHEGFWQPMDTLRDKNYLQDLWDEDKAPWST
jgi:glucose-1-phosphate cytidylyltransferase